MTRHIFWNGRNLPRSSGEKNILLLFTASVRCNFLDSVFVRLSSHIFLILPRVQTSYVAVEPRRKTVPSPQLQPNSPPGEASLSPLSPSNPNVASSRHTAQSPPITHPVSTEDSQSATTRGRNTPGGRELRRARIVITVKRTERYKQWLEENPLQAIIAGDDGDDDQRDSPIPTDSRESGFSSSHQQQKQR